MTSRFPRILIVIVAAMALAAINPASRTTHMLLTFDVGADSGPFLAVTGSSL